MPAFISSIEFAAALVSTVPATLASFYLLVLTALSATSKPHRCASRTLTLDVVIPAHNEAAGIFATVSNLLQLDWPKDRFRVLVVADNCTDQTASVARAAGAQVLERNDLERRGKGYALAHAFQVSCAENFASAVVVVDADSRASPNLLAAFAHRIEAGELAMQAHYGVLNSAASWRTRLMSIALGSIHKLRSRARERMRLSCGIRGNGWCVTHALLNKVPYRAFSLTEDVEFGVDLGLAGYRVAYCDESCVNGEMVTTEQASRSQRQRWEGGRWRLIRTKVPRLLRAALSKPSAVCLDLALDLLILPLSYIVLNVLAAVIIAVPSWKSGNTVFLWLGVCDAMAIALYVGRGWALSDVGLAGFWDLLRVPVFVFWKIMLMLSKRAPMDWIRTKREGS